MSQRIITDEELDIIAPINKEEKEQEELRLSNAIEHLRRYDHLEITLPVV